MKITFVGSSHGVPEPNRKCSCIMVEVGEKIYFVDMGAPAVDAIITRGLDINNVKGVFITHMHGDHTNGLIQFIDLATWYFRQTQPVFVLPCPEEAKAGINAWLSANFIPEMREFEFRKTEPGVVYDDGTVRMTAIATQHCKLSHAYLLEAEGKAVLFTGDLKNPQVDFPAIAFEKHLDLLVCESAHFSTLDYLPVLEKCDIDKVCVNHYSDRFLVDVMQLLQAMKEKGRPALRATDDLIITV